MSGHNKAKLTRIKKKLVKTLPIQLFDWLSTHAQCDSILGGRILALPPGVWNFVDQIWYHSCNSEKWENVKGVDIIKR